MAAHAARAGRPRRQTGISHSFAPPPGTTRRSAFPSPPSRPAACVARSRTPCARPRGATTSVTGRTPRSSASRTSAATGTADGAYEPPDPGPSPHETVESLDRLRVVGHASRPRAHRARADARRGGERGGRRQGPRCHVRSGLHPRQHGKQTPPSPGRMTTLLGEILEGEPLTERETEILAATADGHTAAETGRRLSPLVRDRAGATASASSRSSARGTARTPSRSPSGRVFCRLPREPELVRQEARAVPRALGVSRERRCSISSSGASTLIQAGWASYPRRSLIARIGAFANWVAVISSRYPARAAQAICELLQERSQCRGRGASPRPG